MSCPKHAGCQFVFSSTFQPISSPSRIPRQASARESEKIPTGGFLTPTASGLASLAKVDDGGPVEHYGEG
jgi:hypothetical protein